MHYRQLGTTDLQVSLIGLGTMTWGEQNTEEEAHQQMDYALAHGVNLFDVAEMYPVPPCAETQGLTERYIGTWFKKSGRRRDVILATKASGPSTPTHDMRYIRNGQTHHNRANLLTAVDNSLKRLQTDYIDLYQLHWPERTTNTFGRLGYPRIEDADAVSIEETVLALADLVKAGKIRHVGVSNETPWGVAQFLQMAEKHALAPMVSIQNPYSLLNRTFEVGLAEFSHRSHVGLLAYSPLAFGVLTGKYLEGARPANARLTLFERFTRYAKPEAQSAAARYVSIARQHGLSPAQMALAFVNSRLFTTSNLIGATNIEQLAENIASVNVLLSDEVLAQIEAVHVQQPNPAP